MIAVETSGTILVMLHQSSLKLNSHGKIAFSKDKLVQGDCHLQATPEGLPKQDSLT